MQRRLLAYGSCVLALMAAACSDEATKPQASQDGSAGGGSGTCEMAAVNPEAAAARPLPPPAYTSLIVKLRTDRVSAATAPRLAQALASARRTAGGEYVVPVPRGVQAASLAEQLRAYGEVEYIEPNYKVRAYAEPNDPCYPKQWHYFKNGVGSGQSPGGANLPATWDTNTGDGKVVVAVIDTGLLAGHADVASAMIAPGTDLISDPQNARDGDGRDSDPDDPGDEYSSWHGTHVAGTVGVLGTNNGKGAASVAWNIKVQAVRVLGWDGGDLSDLEDGIRWAAGIQVPGASPEVNSAPASIINLSLGMRAPCPKSLQAAIDAVAQRALVVVAAGNSGQDASLEAPANCKNVLVVAATDNQARLASFSNYGQTVKLSAPGVQVLSAVKGGYAYYNGTSMAAPHVAGVAALVRGRYPALTPAQVTQRLYDGAKTITCSKPCGRLLDAGVAK